MGRRTRRALLRFSGPAVVQRQAAGSLKTVLLRESAAGSLVGVALLLGALVPVAIEELATGVELAPLALAGAFGAGVTVLVGLVFGLVFTLLDVGALRILGLFVGPETTDSNMVDSGAVGEQN